MKNFKIILMIITLFSMLTLHAEDNNSTVTGTTTSTEFEPTTEDKLNPKLLNTLPAVNILNLSGKDCDGVAIKRFVIHTVPDVNAGTLYLANGKTEVASTKSLSSEKASVEKDGLIAVTPNQYLTIEEADRLQFDPNENFEGNATFTYSSVDSNELVDSSPATVTLPIVAPSVASNVNNGGNTGETNTTDNHLTHDDSCGCEAYEESIPSFSKIGFLGMLILSMYVGLFFMRKETSL
jgi:hypothetical protein